MRARRLAGHGRKWWKDGDIEGEGVRRRSRRAGAGGQEQEEPAGGEGKKGGRSKDGCEGRRVGPAGALKEKRRGLAEEGRGPGTGEDHEKSGQSIEGEGSQWRPFDREDDGFVFRTGEDRGEAEGERARVGLYPGTCDGAGVGGADGGRRWNGNQ